MTIYEHINYGGIALELTADTPDLRTHGVQWNDQASSVKVPAGAQVTLYQDINYGGASLVLTADAPDLRAWKGPGADGTWNDAASSVKVSATGVRLMQDGRYVEATPAFVRMAATPSDAGLVVLTKHAGDLFDCRFVQANVQLSIQQDGTLQTRAAGTFGGYEQLRATSQPEGVDLLYRAEGAVVLLTPLTIVKAA
jgi:hypothetical protein